MKTLFKLKSLTNDQYNFTLVQQDHCGKGCNKFIPTIYYQIDVSLIRHRFRVLPQFVITHVNDAVLRTAKTKIPL